MIVTLDIYLFNVMCEDEDTNLCNLSEKRVAQRACVFKLTLILLKIAIIPLIAWIYL